MQQKTRKEWKEPNLKVLVRGKPEEAILTHCKTVSAGSSEATPNGTDHGCGQSSQVGNCGACQSRSGS